MTNTAIDNTENLPSFDYTARDYQTILNDLQAYVTATHPELWSDFFESNLGETLARLIAYTGDLLSYANNRVSEEAFLATAQRYASMLRFCKMLDYIPYMSAAASVSLQVVNPPYLLNESSPAWSFTILKGTQIPVGDLIFTTAQDYYYSWDGVSIATGFTFDPTTGNPIINFAASEGVVQTDSFTADGTPYQQYTTSEQSVIQGSWIVTVNGITWTEVPYVELQVGATQTYSVQPNADKTLTIRFGDDVSGGVPANSASVVITYSTGGGTAGNVPALGINSSVLVTVNGLSTTLYVQNLSAASGGADRETIEHIRTWAPASARTVGKAISAEDFRTLASTFTSDTYGTVARASALLRQGTLITGGPSTPVPASNPIIVPANTPVTVGPLASGPQKGQTYSYLTKVDMNLYGSNLNMVLDPNTVNLYLWALMTDALGFPTYGPASSGLKGALLEYLDTVSVICVLPVCLDGENVPVSVDLGPVYVDRRYTLSSVQANIMTAIVNFFMDAKLMPGNSFRMTQFVEAVMAVPGVLSFADEAEVSTSNPNAVVDGQDVTPNTTTQLITRGNIGSWNPNTAILGSPITWPVGSVGSVYHDPISKDQITIVTTPTASTFTFTFLNTTTAPAITAPKSGSWALVSGTGPTVLQVASMTGPYIINCVYPVRVEDFNIIGRY